MKENDIQSKERTPLLVDDEHTNSDILTKLKGICCGFLNIILLTISASAVQLMRRSMPDFELNAITELSSLSVFSIAVLWSGHWPVIPRAECAGVCALIISNYVTRVSGYVSVTLLPIASASGIILTTQIAAAIILFSLILDEKITVLTIISVILCVLGLILLIQPEFIFNVNGDNSSVEVSHTLTTESHSFTKPNTTNIHHENDNVAALEVLKYALPVLCGISRTTGVLIMKSKPYIMANLNDVLFWSLLPNLIFSTIIMGVFETPVLLTDLKNSAYLAIHIVSYTLTWPPFFYALKSLTGNSYTLICSTNIAFLLIAQYTVLSSVLPGHRNWMEVGGVILMLIGTAVQSAFELWRTNKV